MLISLIVPVYNCRKYLPECIESILGQTFSDFELLLIDDGSRDGSSEICDAFQERDPRIRVFHTPNRGVSAARNTGLDHAQGEFIVFVDSDDRIAPEHLQQFADCGIGPNGIAFTNLIEERPSYGGNERVRLYPVPDCNITPQEGHRACLPILAELLRIRCFGWTWNKMFSRATIEQLGLRFERSLSYAEDEVFTARYCAHITHLATRSHPTYYYRYVSGSLLHSRIDPMVIVRTRRLLSRIYEENGFGDEMCYLTHRLFFSRLRRELRRCKTWNDPTTDRLAELLLENWRGINRFSRPEFRKSFYDQKVLLLGWLACGPGNPTWAKLTVKGLHL